MVSDLVILFRELVGFYRGEYKRFDQPVGPDALPRKHICDTQSQVEQETVGCFDTIDSNCWVTERVINQYKRPIF